MNNTPTVAMPGLLIPLSPSDTEITPIRQPTPEGSGLGTTISSVTAPTSTASGGYRVNSNVASMTATTANTMIAPISIAALSTLAAIGTNRSAGGFRDAGARVPRTLMFVKA